MATRGPLLLAALLGAAALSTSACSSSSSGSVTTTDGGGGGVPDDGPVTCVLSTASTLPHVHIDFKAASCVFTLAEAAKTISIPYDLVVDEDVPGFVPASPYFYGSSAANLVLNEDVSGGSQHYCVCDQGLPSPLCPVDDGGVVMVDGGPSGTCGPVTIPAGTYHRTFTWDGRNWGGPSDTSVPMGAPFPAGDYELVVTTSPGSVGDAGMLSATGTLRIRLSP